jgi:1-phosphatidylinositol-4-phosphate 5-kinase
MSLSLTHMDASRHVRPKRTVEVEQVGKLITKDDRAYELMFDILLGIRYSVSMTTAKPKRALLPLDFRYTCKLNFPSSGSNTTPAHPGRDFAFRDYAPKVFRHLREKFGIDSSDYLVCQTNNW